jgi:hypothetical protein
VGNVTFRPVCHREGRPVYIKMKEGWAPGPVWMYVCGHANFFSHRDCSSCPSSPFASDCATRPTDELRRSRNEKNGLNTRIIIAHYTCRHQNYRCKIFTWLLSTKIHRHDCHKQTANNPLEKKRTLFYIGTPCVPRCKHCTSVIKTSQLVTCKVNVAVYSEIRTKHKSNVSTM